LYDDAEYSKNSWRNRNRIKTPQGLLWLTIPVTMPSSKSPIKTVQVADARWGPRHWDSLVMNYAKAPFFRDYQSLLEPLYLTNPQAFLSQVNAQFIQCICSILGITTKITWSMDYHLTNQDPTEKLIELCQQSGAGVYLSGPSASDYLNESLFLAHQIELVYIDYQGYPEYEQRFPPFEHAVSILDLLFQQGPAAPHYMKSFAESGV
jgi:hypothetical protein